MTDKYAAPSKFMIVSGGQTGADQAGLDWAISHNIPHGGWCPKGRVAEKGNVIDPRYKLRETPKGDYLQRTEWNVRDSDATLIFTMSAELSGGSKKTADFAAKHNKPCRHVHPDLNPQFVVSFLERNRVKTLNIAGSRESSAPGIADWVTRMLDMVVEVQN